MRNNLGGNLTLIINSTKADKTSISIRWRIAQESCNAAVTGYQLEIMPNNTITSTKELSNLPDPSGTVKKTFYCNDSTADAEGFITANTSDSCVNQTLWPCLGFDFQLTPLINDQAVGDPTYIYETTTPGDDAYAVISEMQSGVDWLSFQWTSSDKICWPRADRYIINFTDTSGLSGDSQLGTVYINTFTALF